MQISFDGLSGKIAFDEDGNRIGYDGKKLNRSFYNLFTQIYLQHIVRLGYLIIVDPQPDGLVLTSWDVSLYLFICLVVCLVVCLLICLFVC